MTETTETRNGIRWVTQELTLSEFWHPAPPSTRNAGEWARYGYDPDWLGMPQDECLALPARGWPAGVEAALRLLQSPELAAVGNSRLRRRWSDDDGETVDYARALDGMPCWVQPYRAPGGSGGRIKTLVAHAGGNCGIGADSIAWKAYAAVRYVDAMESAGYRVTVDVSCAAARCYRLGHGWHALVHVKAPDDPVDLSQLAAVLSAAAYRWFGFAWKAAADKTLYGGWGKNCDLRPADPEAVYLPAEVQSRTSAQRWLEAASSDRGRA